MGGLRSLARFRHASQGYWEGDCGLCQVGTWKLRARAGGGTVFRPDLELRADGRVEALLLGSSCCAR